MNVLCFFHPKYKGYVAPDLACKACCRIFVDTVKRQSHQDKKIIGTSRYHNYSLKKLRRI